MSGDEESKSPPPPPPSPTCDGATMTPTINNRRLDKNGAIMKLRYLKFLFPTCEEIELYHLLHCNDLNAQRVSEEIERRGHKRINIDEKMQNRKSQTQQMKALQAALAAKEKAPAVDPLETHRKRTKPVVNEARTNNLKENLKKNFPDTEDQLLLKALDAADYNEPLAKKFLSEMQPIDESKYKQIYNWRYVEPEPPVVLYPCKGIQKGDTSFMSITGIREFVSIPSEIVECTTALALLKVDACTSTQDDFPPVERSSQAEGSKRAHLAAGSIFRKLEIKKSLRQGSDRGRQKGSCYVQVCADKQRLKPNTLALGRDNQLARGRNSALRCGHDAKLVQRTHPFFLADPS